jgi:hypothetical protein
LALRGHIYKNEFLNRIGLEISKITARSGGGGGTKLVVGGQKRITSWAGAVSGTATPDWVVFQMLLWKEIHYKKVD